MQQTEIIKGRGIKRKTSLGLVCGISLMGALFLGANGVSADEATPTTPTTATASESKTVVVDEGLTETANKAKEAGLTVNAEPTKNIGTANTEEEATKLAEQAKKEVADQKAQIEKETAQFKASSGEGEKEQKRLVDEVTKNPLVYYGASSQLNDAGDKDFNNNKVTLGEVKSSKGTVNYVNAPSNNLDLDDINSYKSLLNAGTGSQKEINTYYSQGNMFNNTVSLTDKKNLKATPIAISQGESITYKLNYANDSELGQLGVATVEKKVTLVKSPVNTGKVVLLADRYGSVSANLLIGGDGKRDEVVRTGDWSYTVTKKYLDKDGKVIDPKELSAKVYNKYTFGGKEVVKASDFTLPESKMERGTVSNNVTGSISSTKSIKGTFGGNLLYFDQEVVESVVPNNDPTAINPYGQVLYFHAQKLPQVDTSKLAPNAPAKTVNYHLVSYTVNKAKATNNTDKLKKGSIVQVFIEEGGKEIAPKTNTGEKPVDETVTLNHPKEILFEGKTYTFTKQDKVDPTKIPNGQETITYIYKLKETPKPVVVEEKKGDVEVRYVKDDASRTVLKEPVADTVGGKVGSDYDTTDNKPKTITKDGVTYEYVRSEGVEKGKVVEGKTVVTYVYREVQKPVTIHIDKEGNPVAPKEDGTKPFKDIEGYKPEPKDPKNVEDPKGVTVRVYEKVTPKPETPKTPETPQTPNTPEAPKPQPQQPTQAVAKATLPQTGEVASLALTLAGLGLLGLSGLAIKKRED